MITNAKSLLEKETYEKFAIELQFMCDHLCSLPLKVSEELDANLLSNARYYFIAILNDSFDGKLLVTSSDSISKHIPVVGELNINEPSVKYYALILISKLCSLFKKCFISLKQSAIKLGKRLISGFDDNIDDLEKIFVDVDLEIVYRHKFARLILMIQFRSDILFYLTMKIQNDIIEPILIHLRYEQFKDCLLNEFEIKFSTIRGSFLSPIRKKIEQLQYLNEKAFILKFGNHYVKSVDEAIQFVPIVNNFQQLKNYNNQRYSSTVSYTLEKTIPRKCISDVVIELDSPQQVIERNKELTTDRLINFFGGIGQEKIDLKHLYKSYYSPVHGNVVVIEGVKSLPNRNSDKIDPVIEDFNIIELDFLNDIKSSAISINFDIVWADTIINNNWKKIDSMSIYSIHYDTNDCFHTFIISTIDAYFFKFDSNKISSTAPEVYRIAINRLHFNQCLSALCTRLFCHFDLFNGRSLEGQNFELRPNPTLDEVSANENFNIRYITKEIMIHLLQYSLNFNIDTMIDKCKLLISKFTIISFNMCIIFGVVFRSLIALNKSDICMYEELNKVWIHIMSKFTCNNDNIEYSINQKKCELSQQKNVLNLYMSLYTLVPFPWKNKLSYTSVKTSHEYDNILKFNQFLQQQNDNIQTMNLTLSSIDDVIQQSSQNSEIILSCIYICCLLVKYLPKCYPVLFHVTLGSKTLELNVTVFPVYMIQVIVKVITYSLEYMLDNCYNCTVRLVCGLVDYLLKWLTDCLVTRTLTVEEDWSKNKVLKLIFDKVNSFKMSFHDILSKLQDKIAPYLINLLEENNNQIETEGYQSVLNAYNKLQKMEEMFKM